MFNYLIFLVSFLCIVSTPGKIEAADAGRHVVILNVVIPTVTWRSDEGQNLNYDWDFGECHLVNLNGTFFDTLTCYQKNGPYGEKLSMPVAESGEFQGSFNVLNPNWKERLLVRGKVYVDPNGAMVLRFEEFSENGEFIPRPISSRTRIRGNPEFDFRNIHPTDRFPIYENKIFQTYGYGTAECWKNLETYTATELGTMKNCWSLPGTKPIVYRIIEQLTRESNGIFYCTNKALLGCQPVSH